MISRAKHSQAFLLAACLCGMLAPPSKAQGKPADFDVPDGTQGIAVSVKRNPGQTTHQDCLDRGYINNIKPRLSAPAPPVHPDKPHTLRAAMSGSNLTVTADGRVAWEGDLPRVALEFDGPVGLRSDNAHVVFDFLPRQ